MSDTQRHDPYSAFRLRPFRWFIVSLLTMTMAAQVQAVVVGWLVYQATKDPFALGLIGLAEIVPYVSVALLAGYFADRLDRRRISIIALTVLLVATLAVLGFVLVSPSPSVVWPFYAIVAVCGLARSFLQVSRSALVSEIVSPDHYANAATWRSSTWQLGMVLGPALGGVLFAATGERFTFAVNVGLAAISLLAMVAVRHRPAPRGAPGDSVLRNLAEGLAFLRTNRVILAALALDMVAVLFGGAVALMPVFASDILQVGPRGLGLLQAAPGAGAVLTALAIAHRPPFRRAGRALLLAVTVFGACIVGFGLSRSFPLSVALLFISGAADNVSAVIRSTMIQILVPTGMLGRISAVNAIFIGSSNELGAFESGLAARFIGTVPAVVAGGLVAIGTVALTAWKVPVLRGLGEIRRPED
ncbi:MAG: MFS transporter [Gemmatimonadaceae bacterium]|nr:MFS transporter [Gemmatimonadaceae bacterium]